MNHSFGEGRKILRGKQCEGSIINIKLIQHTSVNSNMKEIRDFVKISEYSKYRNSRKSR